MKGYVIYIGYGYYNAVDGYFHDIKGGNNAITIFKTKATAQRTLRNNVPSHLREGCKILAVEVAE